MWARPAPGLHPGAYPGAASRSAAEGTALDAREPPSRLLRRLARRKHSTQKDWCRPSSSTLGSGPTPTGEAVQCGAESRSQEVAGGRNHPCRRGRTRRYVSMLCFARKICRACHKGLPRLSARLAARSNGNRFVLPKTCSERLRFRGKGMCQICDPRQSFLATSTRYTGDVRHPRHARKLF